MIPFFLDATPPCDRSERVLARGVCFPVIFQSSCGYDTPARQVLLRYVPPGVFVCLLVRESPEHKENLSIRKNNRLQHLAEMCPRGRASLRGSHPLILSHTIYNGRRDRDASIAFESLCRCLSRDLSRVPLTDHCARMHALKTLELENTW